MPVGAQSSSTSLVLAVDGFEGPLDWLLEMVRSRRIDLARLSILALVGAFVEAMDAALQRKPVVPGQGWEERGGVGSDLGRWAAWTVMAAELAELHSRLLLPADAPEARAAQAEAEALRRHWIRRSEMAAATAWLERRPQLGREAFGRGAASVRQNAEIDGGDITALLRACLAALRLPSHIDAYQPRPRPFWSIADASERIVRLLAGLQAGAALEVFLPEPPDPGPDQALHRRTAIAATLVAGLELTRGGTVALNQDAPWQPIHVQSSAVYPVTRG